MSNEILTPAEYAVLHQKAFRSAFDFLTAHFPPGPDPGWWDQTAKDCSVASVSCGENTLVIELLNGIMEYLGTEWRLRNSGETGD